MENREQSDQSNQNSWADLRRKGWWLAGLLVLLPLLVVVLNQARTPIKITQERFEAMLKAGQVDQVTILENQDRVEVRVNAKALQHPHIRQELGNRSTQESAYYFSILNAEFFERDLEALQSNTPPDQRIVSLVEYRSGLGSFLVTWIVIGCIFLLAAFLWLNALADILRSSYPSPFHKIGWLLAVIAAPVVGLLLYYAVGQRQKVVRQSTRPA